MAQYSGRSILEDLQEIAYSVIQLWMEKGVHIINSSPNFAFVNLRLKFALFSMISLLKIWNLNSLSGVIGIFNCQGAGTWPGMVSNEDGNSSDRILTGSVRPVDIEFLENIAGKDWTGDSAVYSFNAGNSLNFFRLFSFLILN